jgi:hypothetical protein
MDDRAEQTIKMLIDDDLSKPKPKPLDQTPFIRQFKANAQQEATLDMRHNLWDNHAYDCYGSKYIRDWYLEYLSRLTHILQFRNNTRVDVDVPKRNFPIAFHDIDKQVALMHEGYEDIPRSTPINSFPSEQLKANYQLKHVSPRYTWLVDVMFFNDFAYYCLINANTRYLFMISANHFIEDGQLYVSIRTNKKGEAVVDKNNANTIYSYINALSVVVSKYPIWFIIGDGQKGFNSDDIRVQTFYRDHGLQPAPGKRFDRDKHGVHFIPIRRIGLNSVIEKDEPYHNSLAIIDRVGRTLRDMYYTINPNANTPETKFKLNVDPFVMKELVNQYNLAPHKTLTRYGPGFRISPNMAMNDYDLERFICRSISQQNWVAIQREGYSIPIGSIVIVLNETTKFDKKRSKVRNELFRVIDNKHGKYIVRGMKSGVELVFPRWKINLADLRQE